MPIYEYECTQCGMVHEVIQKFSDKALTKCRQCSGKLHKLISHTSFHLKGTGWYVTDYAGKSSSQAAAKQKEGDTSTTDASDSGKSKDDKKTAATE